MQLGLLDDADSCGDEVALSGEDEQILNELMARARKTR